MTYPSNNTPSLPVAWSNVDNTMTVALEVALSHE